jgi:hypothetical protein
VGSGIAYDNFGGGNAAAGVWFFSNNGGDGYYRATFGGFDPSRPVEGILTWEAINAFLGGGSRLWLNGENVGGLAFAATRTVTRGSVMPNADGTVVVEMGMRGATAPGFRHHYVDHLTLRQAVPGLFAGGLHFPGPLERAASACRPG